MKTTTMTFDSERLERLKVLIVAAGKSPATDGNVMLAASEMVQWLLQQEQAAASQPELNLVPNGKAA